MGQGAVLFIAWVLTIALFTRDGTTDGRVGWYFGLVRLPELHDNQNANVISAS